MGKRQEMLLPGKGGGALLLLVALQLTAVSALPMQNNDGSFSSYNHGYENHWQQDQSNGNLYNSFFGGNNAPSIAAQHDQSLNLFMDPFGGQGMPSAPVEHAAYPQQSWTPQYAQYNYGNQNYPQHVVHPTVYAPSSSSSDSRQGVHDHAYGVPSWSAGQRVNYVDDSIPQPQDSSTSPPQPQEVNNSEEISLEAVRDDPIAVYGWPTSDTEWKRHYKKHQVREISANYQAIGAGEKRTKQRHLQEKCNEAVAWDLLSTDMRRQERAALYMHHLYLPKGIGEAKKYWKGEVWDIIHKMATNLHEDVGAIISGLDSYLTPSMAAKLDSKSKFDKGLHDFVQAVEHERYRIRDNDD